MRRGEVKWFHIGWDWLLNGLFYCLMGLNSAILLSETAILGHFINWQLSFEISLLEENRLTLTLFLPLYYIL